MFGRMAGGPPHKLNTFSVCWHARFWQVQAPTASQPSQAEAHQSNLLFINIGIVHHRQSWSVMYNDVYMWKTNWFTRPNISQKMLVLTPDVLQINCFWLFLPSDGPSLKLWKFWRCQKIEGYWGISPWEPWCLMFGPMAGGPPHKLNTFSVCWHARFWQVQAPTASQPSKAEAHQSSPHESPWSNHIKSQVLKPWGWILYSFVACPWHILFPCAFKKMLASFCMQGGGQWDWEKIWTSSRGIGQETGCELLEDPGSSWQKTAVPHEHRFQPEFSSESWLPAGEGPLADLHHFGRPGWNSDARLWTVSRCDGSGEDQFGGGCGDGARPCQVWGAGSSQMCKACQWRGEERTSAKRFRQVRPLGLAGQQSTWCIHSDFRWEQPRNPGQVQHLQVCYQSDPCLHSPFHFAAREV